MPLITNVFRNSNITSGINACQSIKNKVTNVALSSSSAISFQFSIRSTCLSLFYFVCVHINRSRFGILIPFSISVALSRIAHLLFATTSNSCLSISIALHCAFAIACTYVACYTSTCTSMDSCSSISTTFSSLASFCIVYASTKCYSTARLPLILQ